MSGFAHRFAAQLAHPRGLAGRALGRAMDFANRAPTRWAVDRLDPQPGEHVLDVGCGTGAGIAQVLARAPLQACGIDPSPTMIAAARDKLGSRAELLVCDAMEMPFAPARFDAALALNVFYFCDTEARMIARIRDVLKPGGRLVAYVTARETMELWPFARAGLHRLYDAQDLHDAMVEGGFSPERIEVHARTVARGVTGLLAIAKR